MDRILKGWVLFVRFGLMRAGCGLVGRPLAAPGIPRSRRFAGSRPFRPAKGAFVAGFLALVWFVGMMGKGVLDGFWVPACAGMT